METKTGNTKGLNNPHKELKTFAQAGMKDPMPAPLVIRGTTNNAPITKTADMMPGVMGNSTQQPTFWYSPEMDSLSWLLPKSRIETLRFCKIWYNLNPYIHSILNMHAQYGFSRFKLQCKDPKYTKLFSTLLFWNQEFDWYQFTLDMALSYYKYGEAVCLAGDTAIRLLNGETKTIKELYESQAKDFWVYSIDKDGNVVPGKADTVILTKKNAKVLKVTLDNGKSFKCTPEHKCMLRDGSYVEAKELKAGMALMPFYTKQNNVYYKADKSKQTYEMVYNPGLAKSEVEKTGTWKYTHRLVSDYTNGVQRKGMVVHHKNFNKNDNTPENLALMSLSEHQKLHTHNYTPEQIEVFRQRTKELYEQPGYAEWIGGRIKESMTPEVREKISAASKRVWANEDYRISQSKRRKGSKHSAETVAKLKERAMERYLKNPEDVMNRLKKATEAAAKANTGRKYSEERKKQISERMKAAWKAGVYKNHKVVSVEECGSEDVYDIRSVDGFHNFALDCGVFVHNCWGSWNSARRTWDRFTLIDPALVEYKEDLFTGHATIELIPTVEMKQTVKEAIMQGRTDIDPMLLDAVQNNKKLPLDTEGTEENVFTGQKYSPAKVFVFSRKTDPSSTRGTSIIQSLFKDLIYADMLRMSQVAVAQKTQLPIELWTVGHLGSDEQSSILPGPEMLEEVRAMITNATQQPPYSIVYGPYLKYEALGVSGKLLDIYNDLGYVENQILVGLGVNKAVVLGEGPNVQGKAISLNRLIREYATVRDLFANFVKRYILLPIAKANNLLDEDGQYIVPDLVWELSLQPEQDKEKFDMCYKMWKDGLISTMSLFEKCPEKFDYILEMKRLEEEKGSCFDKGDRRLGGGAKSGSTGGTPVASGASTSGGNVRDGKGNPDLRDFALGGNNASAINSGSDNTDVGDGANAQQGA